jgi:exopolysaccharide production protein ExoQ
MLTAVKNKKWWVTTMWFPFLWLAIQNSKGLTFWQSTQTDVKAAYMEGSPVDRIVLSLFIIIVMMILYKRKETVVWLIGKNYWLIALIAFMGISVIWSELPFISLKRWVRSFGTLSMFLLICSEEHPFQSAAKVVELLASVFVVGSLLGIVLFPDICTEIWSNGQAMWLGLTIHKNTLGQYGAIGTVFFFWRIITVRQDRFILYSPIMMFLSVVVLIGSKSFTSLSIAFVAVAVMLLMKLSQKFGKYNVIFFLLFIPAVFAGLQFIQNGILKKPIMSYILEVGDKDETFSGRTDIWRFALEGATTKEKLVGKGYAIFWETRKADRIRYLLDWDFFNGHNGYMDFYLQLGIIGLMLLTGFLVHTLVTVLKQCKTDSAYSTLYIGFFLMSIISNLFESNFGTPNGLLWFLMLLASMKVRPHETAVQEMGTEYSL